MLVYAATKNGGKRAELRALFRSAGWRVETFTDYRDVAEGEASYAVNAAAKAVALREQLLAAGIVAGTLGDDSGLEVGALGGRPGVLSARYGGDGATWSQRRERLLRELAATGSLDRSARFVCALHYIDAAGRELAVRGEVTGQVAWAAAGDGGFSYDAIFYYEPFGRTFGELSDAHKNGVSHRAQAVAALLQLAGHNRALPEKQRGDGNAGG